MECWEREVLRTRSRDSESCGIDGFGSSTVVMTNWTLRAISTHLH